MNSIMQNYYGIFAQYQSLRSQMMELLQDDDLAFAMPGNVTLGDLCRAIGEVERSYIDSFKTFSQDFSYRNDEPGLVSSVAQLSEWYAALDSELRSVIESFSEDDLQNKVIDRGFKVPIQIQLTIYNEALLIFYGKASVYLKALGKTLPKQWVHSVPKKMS